MYIKTKIQLVPETSGEIRKDKTFHLKMWRLMRAVDGINDLCEKFALGKIYLDDECVAVIHGMRWIHK